MRHPNALSLAKRLLDSRVRQLMARSKEDNYRQRFTPEEIAFAEEILATHLDACLCAGIHSDLFNAVDESLDFAMRHEKAYEPIPMGVRWHGALVVIDQKEAN